jgi:hypothetical protein
MHYKNNLFYQPDSLEALQDLGCLLIISGGINEGEAGRWPLMPSTVCG